MNAGNLIREASFYSGLKKIAVRSMEAYRPVRSIYYGGVFDFPVSFIFDISRTFEKKFNVLKCYDSQFFNNTSDEEQTFISTKLFEKEIEARARHFGFKIGVEYGEPYFVQENIKADDKTIFDIF